MNTKYEQGGDKYEWNANQNLKGNDAVTSLPDIQTYRPCTIITHIRELTLFVCNENIKIFSIKNKGEKNEQLYYNTILADNNK